MTINLTVWLVIVLFVVSLCFPNTDWWSSSEIYRSLGLYTVQINTKKMSTNWKWNLTVDYNKSFVIIPIANMLIHSMLLICFVWRREYPKTPSVQWYERRVGGVNNNDNLIAFYLFLCSILILNTLILFQYLPNAWLKEISKYFTKCESG